MSRIYLDHAATTPLRPEAREAMLRGFEMWANPSSPHAEGRKARAALEDARERVKAALGWKGEVIFTSGASEAAAIAITQADADEQLVSAVEHNSILSLAGGATVIPVREDGLLEDAAFERELAACSKPLVIVQTENSETGVDQDIGAIADRVREVGGLFLSDASQSAGKSAFLPYEYEADMIVVSAHKLGGPVGIGALLVKDFAMLRAVGGQERGYRRGTENLPGAMGFAAALEACTKPYVRNDVDEPLEQLLHEVRVLGGRWINDGYGFIHAIAMPGLSGKAQLMRFDLQGISVSQGSACSSGSLHSSHVLKAMGVPDVEAERTIRVSLGWNTTREEVERFCEAWLKMAREGAERAA